MNSKPKKTQLKETILKKISILLIIPNSKMKVTIFSKLFSNLRKQKHKIEKGWFDKKDIS